MAFASEGSINRYYDPTTEQFLSVDPAVALTGQPYAYTGDNPVDNVDPLGLSWYNPFSWSGKTWENIGIGLAVVGVASFGVGAIGLAGWGAIASLSSAGEVTSNLAILIMVYSSVPVVGGTTLIIYGANKVSTSPISTPVTCNG